MIFLDEDLALFALNFAQQLGAEYSEARLHKCKEITCLLRNGFPEPAIISDSYGLGIRILHSGFLSFGATNILS